MTSPNAFQELALARSIPKFQFHYVDTDAMTPTYKIGQWLIFTPVEDFLYPAVYTIDGPAGPVVYRFDSRGTDHLTLLRHNKFYGQEQVPLDWFRENVLAFVIGSMSLPHHLKDPNGPRWWKVG